MLFLILSSFLLGRARVPLRIASEYSGNSGLIGEIGIGTPVQHLRVSFRFQDFEFWVRQFNDCPPFVGDCFNPGASGSYRNGRDRVEIGQSVFYGIRVHKLPLRIVNPSALFSEVVGMVGMSPMSELMADRLLQIHESTDGKLVMEEVDSVNENWITVPALYPYDNWGFRMPMTVNGKSVSVDYIIYDPKVQKIEIPRRLKEEVLEMIGRGARAGRRYLTAPCDAVIKVFLGDILLDPDLIIRKDTPDTENPGFCWTRIRVSNCHTVFIYIGRLLTRSVDNVILDYRAKSVHWDPKPVTRLRTPYAHPTSSVPTFRAGTLSDGLFAYLREPIPSTAGFIPLSTEIHNIDHLGKTFRGFMLVRVGDPADIAVSHLIVKTGVSGLTVDMDAEGVRFRFNEHGKEYIEITETPKFIIVSIRNIDSIGPGVFSIYAGANPDKDICSICQVEIKRGHKMYTTICEHRFHFLCLYRWLSPSNSQRRCPLCKGELPA